MSEEQEKFFRNLEIPEEEIKYCYFSQEGKPFVPLKDSEGNIIKTGEQVCNEDYLISPAPQPTQDEILRAKLLKDNVNIQLQLSAQQRINADILLKLAKVGGVTNA